MANYRIVMKDESLSHHGIEGQKWGVRNGPPYPLSAGDHSAAEKRALKKEGKQTYKLIKKYNKKSKNSYKLVYGKNPKKNIQARTINTIDEDLDKLLDLYKKDNQYELEGYFNKLSEDILGKYAYKEIKTRDPRYVQRRGLVTMTPKRSGYTPKSIGFAKDILADAMLDLGKNYLYTVNYFMNGSTGTISIKDKDGKEVGAAVIDQKDWT